MSRRILDEAARGVPFDEMAIVVRAPESYWGPIEQALERAKVPAWFSRGTRRPGSHRPGLPRAARLRGRRPVGAELRRIPVARPGAAARPGDRPIGTRIRRRSSSRATRPSRRVSCPCSTCSNGWTARPGAQPGADPGAEPALSDQCLPTERTDVRAPWRWESLLVDAAVASEAGPTGRAARWHRRLGGLRAELELRLSELQSDEPESGRVAAVTRDLEALDDLSRFALPLVDELAGVAGAGALGRMARSPLGAGAARAAAPRARAAAARRPAPDGGGRSCLARRGAARAAAAPRPARSRSAEVALRPGLRGDARRAARANVPRRVRGRPRRAGVPAAQPRGSAAARRHAQGPGRAARRRGRSRPRRARAPPSRRRCGHRALLAVLPAARRRPGTGAGAVVLRAGRRARVDRRGPRSRPLRARHRDRDRRVAGVAGAR